MRGAAADQISRFANQGDVDLMVLSAHGSDAEEGPLGPVGTRVLGRVTRPLFLVRASGPSLLGPPDDAA